MTDLADEVAVLDFADEESVVQTRFATTALALFRAHLEAEDALPEGVATVEDAARDAEQALSTPLDENVLTAGQFTFLGSGWTYGLALEAGLKMREAAGAWTEAYPAMEYRHGPISITGPGRVAWGFGALPAGLADDVRKVGGILSERPRPARGPDPRPAPRRRRRRGPGLNPDTPAT